ncbi:MAG: hypothetical protein HC801_09805 [Nitrospira sp.]|nr:hypothetical protein [Nitrospira sp.]
MARSKREKKKLLGGAQVFYELHLRVEIPDAEAALMGKYPHEGFRYRWEGELNQLIERKTVQVNGSLSLPGLERGIKISCEGYLDKTFCAFPERVLQEYRHMMGVIRALEGWGGAEVLED